MELTAQDIATRLANLQQEEEALENTTSAKQTKEAETKVEHDNVKKALNLVNETQNFTSF